MDYDMNKVLPILRSFGVSPENLGPEKLEKLQHITGTITDVNQITTEKAREILDLLGISTKGAQKQIVRTVKKIHRNDPCPCGMHKKYKKCCGKLEE